MFFSDNDLPPDLISRDEVSPVNLLLRPFVKLRELYAYKLQHRAPLCASAFAESVAFFAFTKSIVIFRYICAMHHAHYIARQFCVRALYSW
jgi:hypothetical protein